MAIYTQIGGNSSNHDNQVETLASFEQDSYNHNAKYYHENKQWVVSLSKPRKEALEGSSIRGGMLYLTCTKLRAYFQQRT